MEERHLAEKPVLGRFESLGRGRGIVVHHEEYPALVLAEKVLLR